MGTVRRANVDDDGEPLPTHLIDAAREYAGSVVGGKALGISLPPRPSPTRGRVTGQTQFERATFEARVTEVKHMASGEMRVVFLIAESDRHEGVKLGDAYSCGLSVDVTKLSYG